MTITNVLSMEEKYCIWEDVHGIVHRINDVNADFNLLQDLRLLEAFYSTLSSEVKEPFKTMVLISETRDIDSSGRLSKAPRLQIAYVFFPEPNEIQFWINGKLGAVWRDLCEISDAADFTTSTSSIPPGVAWNRYSLFENTDGIFHLIVHDHEDQTLYYQSSENLGLTQLFEIIRELESENRDRLINVDNPSQPPKEKGKKVLAGDLGHRFRKYYFENFGEISKLVFFNEWSFKTALKVLVAYSHHTLSYEMADIVFEVVSPHCKTETWKGDDSQLNRHFGLRDFLLDGQFSPLSTPQDLAAIWDKAPEIDLNTVIGYALFGETKTDMSGPEYIGGVEEILKEVQESYTNALAVKKRMPKEWEDEIFPDSDCEPSILGHFGKYSSYGSNIGQINEGRMELMASKQRVVVPSCAWFVQVAGEWKRFIQDERHALLSELTTKEMCCIRVELIEEPQN